MEEDEDEELEEDEDEDEEDKHVYPKPCLVNYELDLDGVADIGGVLLSAVTHPAYLLALRWSDLQFIKQLESDYYLGDTYRRMMEHEVTQQEYSDEKHLYSNIQTIERALCSRTDFAKYQMLRLYEYASFFAKTEKLREAFDGVKHEIQNVSYVLAEWPTETIQEIWREFKEQTKDFTFERLAEAATKETSTPVASAAASSSGAASAPSKPDPQAVGFAGKPADAPASVHAADTYASPIPVPPVGPTRTSAGGGPAKPTASTQLKNLPPEKAEEAMKAEEAVSAATAATESRGIKREHGSDEDDKME